MNKMSTDCLQQLERIREDWLKLNSSKPMESSPYVVNENIEVNGKIYRHDIYEDCSGDRMFVVFELSKDKLVGSSRYCLGIEYFNEEKPSLVTMEELWDEGIP